MISWNKILVPMILVATLSLLFAPSLASAEIKVTPPPPNWQPAPTNNSTSMAWFQNSTKSVFGIMKAPINPPLPLAFAAPFMGQFLANKGVLESADQLSFGHSNYGYRYILNLNHSSLELLNSSSAVIQEGDYDVPLKEMWIVTEKQGDIYGIFFGSPRENFDSVLNEIKPFLDSIQLTNSTATN
jgi:hypothetical protein